MPTTLTHAFISVSVGGAAAPTKLPLRFWFVLGVLGVLPDLDVIAFRFGIRYESMWGHRGLSHSPAFAPG